MAPSVLTYTKNALVLTGLLILAGAFFCTYAVAYVTSIFSPRLRAVWLEFLKATYSQISYQCIWLISPAEGRVYTESPNVQFEIKDGEVRGLLTPRAVVMCNHQTYVDWAYLWWLAYAADCHAGVCIMLKESLGKIPIFGWIMHCYRFLFLTRSFAHDEPIIQKRIKEMNMNPRDPLWVVLYPEGTVYNHETHDRSEKYAAKIGAPPSIVPKHMLLPRIKGLQTVLQGLSKSTKVLYDVTMVYSPVSTTGEPAETFYSLVKTFIRSEGAPVVKFHIREFAINEIPYQDEHAFETWLCQRYLEKDEIYEKLSTNQLESQFVARGPIRMRSWWNLYSCLNMPILLALLVRILYKTLL